MIAALPIIVGVQLLLAFLSYDIQSVPRSTLHLRLKTSALPRCALAHQGNAPALETAAGEQDRPKQKP
jgi:hypothetical protein